MEEELNEDIEINEKYVRARRETLVTMRDEGIDLNRFSIKNFG